MSGNLAWVAVAILLALAAGTVIRLSVLRWTGGEQANSRLMSLLTWWLVAAVVLACAQLGITATAALFMVVSGIALHELLRLFRGVQLDWGLIAIGYGLVPLNYLAVWLGSDRFFIALLPLALLLFSARLVISDRPEGFVRTAASLVWAVLLTTTSLCHAVLLFQLPPAANPVAGGAGWFLYLVILTEANDIAQALVGRRFGKRKMAPRLSPRKTREGLIGGVGATVVLAALLAPWLTPLRLWQALVAGSVISLGGSVGDLNESAIKREAGVKDSGSILPGQGGMLDRIDSLTFTAPLFYYLVWIFASP